MRVLNSSLSKVVALVATVASTTFFGGQALAQGPAIAQPIANWSYTGHSSTLVEGALRGQSAVISSVGQTIYLDSLAAVNYAEAYKRAIENSVALTKSYYERRAFRDEYFQKYGPKAFVGDARKKFIEYYQPKRLSAQEFDYTNGKLTWPHILRQQQFAPVKEQIDQVFLVRSVSNSGDGSASHREIYQLCNAMSGLLRENIGIMTADQYINGLEFLRSVELEAKTAIPSELVKGPLEAQEGQAAEEPKLNPGEAPAINKDTDMTIVRPGTTRIRT